MSEPQNPLDRALDDAEWSDDGRLARQGTCLVALIFAAMCAMVGITAAALVAVLL